MIVTCLLSTPGVLFEQARPVLLAAAVRQVNALHRKGTKKMYYSL